MSQSPTTPVSPPTTDAGRARTIAVLRRVIVTVIVVSFALAALGGIAVLLGAELGSAAGQVLATTAVVGAFSVAVLCCAALIGRRVQLVGVIGVLVSVLAAVLVIVLIWGEPRSDGFFQWMLTLISASSAFALGSLLLLLADRRRPAVRLGLIVTLALFVLVLALVVNLIWNAPDIDGDLYPRLLGIVSILAALGGVVVPVMSLLMPDARPAGEARVTPGLAARLEAEAARRGVTVEQLVAPLLSGSADPGIPAAGPEGAGPVAPPAPGTDGRV
ncbi:hypothetical protein [Microbacterium sp. No. 7]|uniref:hypothetical protein n=1 Tax=Microbacterium sp. No. 7 TaxID=1714373 RepID=UPI0006CFF3EE|nr:hypothetical protein [Microbacterium sp. No. 7]ALJ21107.1 hypothetical protein AOA12_14825 [Microbacterium sp. No. 7]